MGSSRGSLTSLDMDIRKLEVQLLVTPLELKFPDALTDRVYRLPLTIQNFGPWTRKIRFKEPSKPQFKLMLTNLCEELAPGFQMTVVVEYHPDRGEDTFDQLIISAGTKRVEIPLIGLTPSCKLEIDSVVDFDTLLCSHKAYSKDVSIINHGKVPGMFNIEYQGQVPILFFPACGTVKPESSVIVRVKFYAYQPNLVNEVAKVSLQGHPDIFLNIQAHVFEKSIELFNMSNDAKFEYISFDSVYFGTSKIEHVLLHNNSPGPINWVAVMQNNCAVKDMNANHKYRTRFTLDTFTRLADIRKIDVSTVISCIPAGGSLLPYQKTVVTFCFTPKPIVDDDKSIEPSHRQDYAFFMRLDSLESEDVSLTGSNYKSIKRDRVHTVHIALIASGLPVLLHFDPGKILKFPSCSLGECSRVTCIIENQSVFLPVTYHFPKTEHFKIEPERGKIEEGCIQIVKCSFIPSQVGIFETKQMIEIIGSVADENFLFTSMKPFYHIYLNFSSVCTAVIKDIVMGISTGIFPLVIKPTGHFVVKDVAKYKDRTPTAMLQSAKTRLHDLQLNEDGSLKDTLIPLPNDRAASIRPGKCDKCCRPVFTKISRHNYPDFDFAEFEKIEQRRNQNYYSEYTKKLKIMHLKKQAEREDTHPANATSVDMHPSNDRDIDVHPSSDSDMVIQSTCDLTSPLISQEEIEEERSLTECLIKASGLSTREIAYKEVEPLERKVLKALKSDPCTRQEKHDCSINLTPKQIQQVIVGPSVINFGYICLNSTNTRLLHVVNMLSIHILIQLEVNFEELQKTNQFSYVIPPISNTCISMIFESSSAGKFWKSFTFTVNSTPGGHILVMADVRPIKLQLSSNTIVLKPRGFLWKPSFWGTVTLYNRQNLCAEFGWQVVKAIAFSISPANGIVEAYSSLQCEVMWRPGFGCPEEGELVLHVRGGNTVTLKCVAYFDHTEISISEPTILFENSPQRLTTLRETVLYNVGQNHAYFEVCEQSPLPIINIFPSQGLIPYGGVTVLNISCTSFIAEKFETNAKIFIHRGNNIEVKISGCTEIADVEIRPNLFQFKDTYVGSTTIIPFVVENKGLSRAAVELQLKQFPEFSMYSKDKSGKFINRAPYIYFLDLEGKSSLECSLSFSPKQVKTIDFTIQIQINSFMSSKWYAQYSLTKNSSITKRIPLIQPCIVQARGIKPPLELSSTEFIFSIPLHEIDPNNGVVKMQDLILYNASGEALVWSLDLSGSEELFKEDIFSFTTLRGIMDPNEECIISISFSPKQPRKYTADVPIYLNDSQLCYRMIHLNGEVKSPKLLFDPPFVHLPPVPLDVTTGMDVTILPQNYFMNSTLNFPISDDGEVHPISVVFTKDKIIKGSKSGVNKEITCHISFKSSKPVSVFSNLLFHDDNNNWYSLPVAATADNCILTIYPYLAAYLNKNNLILKDDVGEGRMQTTGSFLIPYQSSTSLSPATEPIRRKLFVGMEIAYEDLDTSEKPKTADGDSLGKEKKNEKLYFPKEGEKTYNFFQKVVNAAETWFSLFGWPEGPHLLSIPETIRRDVQKVQFDSSPEKACRKNDVFNSDKTIFDVLLHLNGKMPPEIYASSSLPENDTERVMQLFLQHSSLLNFLDVQGGCVSHILPEFLFDPEDYKKWLEISSSSKHKESCTVTTDMDKFDSWSKRAWTDVFLQIYKVLVLSRVLPCLSSALPMINVHNKPTLNPNFESSNIYSDAERILLSWLNTNYENTRHSLWKKSHTGTIPFERWIINFDRDLSDGLVFASQLATYCPFLIESHLVNMYARPNYPEQYLHNCLLIIDCFDEIGLNMNIQAVDIFDPNPIRMLMLCVYMYEKLPEFLPKKVVSFHCALHDTVLREITLKNPSSENIVYTATVTGRDAANFTLIHMGNVTISPKNKITITVKFTSCFLRSTEASLLLISKCKRGVEAIPMAFTLEGQVLSIRALQVFPCRTPCYQWKSVTVHVKNPFPTGGEFSVILLESPTLSHLPTQISESRQRVHRGDKSQENIESTSSFYREFFSSVQKLTIRGQESSSLVLYYLPFNIHTRYCAVILSNKQIGELIYVVQGKGLAPLPSSFPPPYDTSEDEVTHFPEEEENKEVKILYLECRLRKPLRVRIKLPLTNEAKERALAFAAQQQISAFEHEQRLLTGTLESSSIRVATGLLGLSKIESPLVFHLSKLKKPKSVSYTAELSHSDFFSTPEKTYTPEFPQTLPKFTLFQRFHQASVTGDERSQMQKPGGQEDADGFISFPLRFFPPGPGCYPCKILLTSKYDVLIFQVEVVVYKEHTETIVEFEAPAFEEVTQRIRIKNETNKVAKFRIRIEGKWFHGLPILYSRPRGSRIYSLTFRPLTKCELTGKLIVKNEADGLEKVIILKGIGTKPPAFGSVVIHCKVGNVSNTSITVPNNYNSTITYEVSSDIPIVWGDSHITIEPVSSAPYVILVYPRKRGILQGTISFSLKDENDYDLQEETDEDKKFSSPKLSALSPIFTAKDLDDELPNLRVWYQLEIHTSPKKPIKVIEIECVALESTCIEIPISNPSDETVRIDVKLSNSTLSGPKELVLNPLECVNYVVWYSSATIGCIEESVIFQPKKSEEFWYLLQLTTDYPKGIKMPDIICDFGKYVIQNVTLNNPTPETLTLNVTNSNPENYALDIQRTPLVVFPHSIKEVSIYFCPSGLGRTGHKACISFSCTQFGEWKFDLCGVGLFPRPLETVKLSTFIGYEASVVIDFKNPTNENVFLNVMLTNEKKPEHIAIDHCWDSFMEENNAFQFSSLTYTQGILLPPKENIDISVSYMPQHMVLSKSIIIIQMMKESRKMWSIDNFDELDTNFKRTMGLDTEEIRAVHWMYPLIGLPQAPLPKSLPPLIKCQLKKKVDMKVEISLIGDFFGPNPTPESTEFSVIPKRNLYYSIHEILPVIPKTREFEYEIEFESEDFRNRFQSCVDLRLEKKSYSIEHEMITLLFNLKFAPKKLFRCHATLKIESITDGIWKFPFILIVNKPEVDNIINIRGAGLFKESIAELKLTTKSRYPEKFTASFLPGNDPEIFVKPSAGELPPCTCDGTVITVGFKPQLYSKKYKAVLAIQTKEVCQLFEVNGLPPTPAPLLNVKAKVDTTNKTCDNKPIQQRNFVSENANLLSTGVSSTIKGAPLLTKK